MATNQVIKLKRGTSTPTTSNIASGEVAVDTSAQKLFINDSGTIKELGTSAALLSSSTVAIREFEYTASGSQTTFSGNDTGSQSLIYTAGSIMVFLNGILQDDSVDYTATNGTSVVFTTALAANDEVRIMSFITNCNYASKWYNTRTWRLFYYIWVNNYICSSSCYW